MILVTGGAGFIGSAVIRYLIKNTNESVLNLDNLTYAGNLDSLKDISDDDRYNFVKADICDFKHLTNIFKEYKPSSVMHLAAESHVDRSIDSPFQFMKTNFLGTFNLLEASRNFWSTLSVSEKDSFKFHHVSTDEVYGDLDNTSDYFTEETRYDPSSPYSASKASSDHLVRAWNRTYSFPSIITNCSNNYGPFHFPEKLIPHVILNALSGKPIPIYGDGSQIRDWLFVDDHARALYKVLSDGAIGETYNIGGHNEMSNLEVVTTICDILDELIPISSNSSITSKSLLSYKSLITFVSDRPGHDYRYAIDASKIENELGWKPIYSFDSGIRITVEWYLNNKKWWTRVLNGSYRLNRIGKF